MLEMAILSLRKRVDSDICLLVILVLALLTEDARLIIALVRTGELIGLFVVQSGSIRYCLLIK